MDGVNPRCVGGGNRTNLKRRGVVELWFPQSSSIAFDHTPPPLHGLAARDNTTWQLAHTRQESVRKGGDFPLYSVSLFCPEELEI